MSYASVAAKDTQKATQRPPVVPYKSPYNNMQIDPTPMLLEDRAAMKKLGSEPFFSRPPPPSRPAPVLKCREEKKYSWNFSIHCHPSTLWVIAEDVTSARTLLTEKLVVLSEQGEVKDCVQEVIYQMRDSDADESEKSRLFNTLRIVIEEAEKTLDPDLIDAHKWLRDLASLKQNEISSRCLRRLGAPASFSNEQGCYTTAVDELAFKNVDTYSSSGQKDKMTVLEFIQKTDPVVSEIPKMGYVSCLDG
jgi:hypothetical protein